jgi:hypothetical protein
MGPISVPAAVVLLRRDLNNLNKEEDEQCT